MPTTCQVRHPERRPHVFRTPPGMKMPIGVRGADFVPFSAIDFNQWLQGIFIAAKNLTRRL
jgi:hypothetical protein